MHRIGRLYATMSMAMAYEMPSIPMARSVVERWLGPCYKDDFSAESLREVQPLHWGVRDGKPISPEEGAEIDASLADDFGEVLKSAQEKGPPLEWLEDGPRGGLALILLCDQLSRNVYRRKPEAFALDAAEWSLSVFEAGQKVLHPVEQVFVLLPLEHSEKVEDHDLCLQALDQVAQSVDTYPSHVKDLIGLAQNVALDHAEVVRRFGRYPHRNDILGRESTPEELEYLQSGATSWGQ